jgi:hypothetical protein
VTRAATWTPPSTSVTDNRVTKPRTFEPAGTGAGTARGVSAPVRFLVQPMVRGPELLLGFTRDATAGPAVTIVAGGWAVELLSPLLTVSLSGPRSGWDAAALRTLIDSCGLGQAIGDRAAGELAELIAQLAGHFVTGTLAGYATLECNPVTLTGDGPVVVDALLIA